MRFALILSLIIALAAVVFAMQNPGPIELIIPFTGKRLVSTQPVVLISTLLIGLLIGVLASVPGRLGAGLRARRAEKRLAEMEKKRVEAASNVAESRADAAEAHAEAVEARAEERNVEVRLDAEETKRLADEVAQRTADEMARRKDLPPVDPL